MAEAMSLLVECEDCHEKFRIAAGDEAVPVTHKKEFVVKGRSIFVTYYDCPKCGRRHFVQIDDNRSLQMLKENERMFVKLSVKRRNDKEIPQKQSDKYKKQRRHLAEYRTNLMKEYTGVMVHDDETDASFELRFSV